MVKIADRLSERERRFAHLIAQGRGKRQAAIEAGYSPGGAHSQGTRLLQRERILNAIRRIAEKNIVAGIGVGAAVLIRLARGAQSEDVQLRAAQALLDRAGLPLIKTTRTHHLFTDNRSEAELIEHVKRLAAELKVALPAGLIEGYGEPVDNG